MQRKLPLRAEVNVNLRQQSGYVAEVPAIAIISIDRVEGDRASERSCELIHQIFYLLCANAFWACVWEEQFLDA